MFGLLKNKLAGFIKGLTGREEKKEEPQEKPKPDFEGQLEPEGPPKPEVPQKAEAQRSPTGIAANARSSRTERFSR